MINLTAQIDSELARIAGRQLPFATSLALNRTAAQARDRVRQKLPKQYKLNNGWTQRAVRVKPSNKINLLAQVEAPGYLAKHETGETVRPTKSRLLASLAPGVRKTQLARALDQSFRVDMGGGRFGIFQRKANRSIRLLAWLAPEHDYDETLGFEQQVRDEVGARFSPNFAQALSEALQTRR